MKNGFRQTLKGFLFLLSMCLVPTLASAAWDAEKLEKNVTVRLPEREGRHPLILIVQGTGSVGQRERAWAEWFNQNGVAVAMINSAGLRDRKDMNGVDSFFDYSGDIVDVLRWLAPNPGIDTTRFGLIGFSRGGTVALMAGKHFAGPDTAPAFVFAFYPGASQQCPNSLSEKTAVHVFYGDDDDWGLDQQLQRACKAMTEKSRNAFYHAFPGAHHGFDQHGESTFSAGRRSYHKKFNEDARDAARSIIKDAIKAPWGLAAD